MKKIDASFSFSKKEKKNDKILTVNIVHFLNFEISASL